jgi:hypothetical protein
MLFDWSLHLFKLSLVSRLEAFLAVVVENNPRFQVEFQIGNGLTAHSLILLEVLFVRCFEALAFRNRRDLLHTHVLR